jgi:t-SNARE complex subunit (syntaxin)
MGTTRDLLQVQRPEQKLTPWTNDDERKLNHQKIMRKNQEATELEHDAKELKKLFVDVHALVTEQAPKINNIEKNISQAKEKVQDGEQALQEAEHYQRKRGCCIS